MVTNDTLEEGAPCLRPVEDAGIGDLELAEGQLIGVTGLEVVSRKRRGQSVEPAPEEGVHSIGGQPVTDPLEGCLVQLALGPTVAVQPQPDRVGSIRVRLPEGWPPLGIPKSGKEVTSRAPLPQELDGTVIPSSSSGCAHGVIPGQLVSIVVARLVTQFEVVKLVGATACYCLSMVQVQRFFIEQTRLADRTSPLLSGGK